MKFRNLYFGISLAVLIPCIVSLALFGLQPSIDFTGGSLLEVRLSEPQELGVSDFETTVGEDTEIDSVQTSGANQYLVRSSEITNEQKDQVVADLEQAYGPIEVLRFERVGASISQELLTKTVTALILVAGIIMVYVARQFNELKYGICAIIAMFHDSLILIGSFSLLGYFFGVQVDVLFVTALLTTLSFSVHDTIVVYDRIRELRRKYSSFSYEQIVNSAVIQTLSRSLNNSLTIIIMLLALFLLGGVTIRFFALALLIGAVTGTYSSTFTAAPLLLLWDQLKEKRKQ